MARRPCSVWRFALLADPEWLQRSGAHAPRRSFLFLAAVPCAIDTEEGRDGCFAAVQALLREARLWCGAPRAGDRSVVVAVPPALAAALGDARAVRDFVEGEREREGDGSGSGSVAVAVADCAVLCCCLLGPRRSLLVRWSGPAVARPFLRAFLRRALDRHAEGHARPFRPTVTPLSAWAVVETGRAPVAGCTLPRGAPHTDGAALDMRTLCAPPANSAELMWVRSLRHPPAGTGAGTGAGAGAEKDAPRCGLCRDGCCSTGTRAAPVAVAALLGA